MTIFNTDLDYGPASCYEEAIHCCGNCEKCGDCEEQREYYNDESEENFCSNFVDAT